MPTIIIKRGILIAKEANESEIGSTWSFFDAIRKVAQIMSEIIIRRFPFTDSTLNPFPESMGSKASTNVPITASEMPTISFFLSISFNTNTPPITVNMGLTDSSKDASIEVVAVIP